MSESEPRPVGLSGPRRRSAVACQMCRQRKVRCNVYMSGPPCVNCIQDGLTCEVVSKRHYRPIPHAGPSRGHINQTPIDHTPIDHTQRPLPIQSLSEPRPWWPSDRERETGIHQAIPPHQALPPHQAVPPNVPGPQYAEPSTRGAQGANELSPMSNEAAYKDNSLAFTEAIVTDKTGDDPAPFFMGEKQGIAFMLDVFKPDQPAGTGHFLVPKAIINSQQPEDLAYLWAKGAFSIPSADICEALLRAHFQYVHPFLPVVDAKWFINQYMDGGTKRISTLLLWAMLSNAVNFVDYSVVEAAGYKSRKEMKRIYYQRAKALYDCNFEEDKIILAQSILCMSFWYSDTDDRTGAWHWIGVAISLCQALGLHRNPDHSQINRHLPDRQRKLWRRLWWTCLLRDCWVSFVLGRPLRINLNDCDVPLPFPDDVLMELNDIPREQRDIFGILASSDLALCWVNLVKLSIVLGRILSINGKPDGLLPQVAEVERCEVSIIDCAQAIKDDAPRLVKFKIYEYQLHFEATMIALYRPYLLREMVGAPAINGDVFQRLAKQRVRDATTNTQVIIDKIVSMDMVSCIGPMTLTVIVPTMHIHLLALRSSNSLTRRLGLHKLDFYMTVMSELANIYWSADFIYKIFKGAIGRLVKEDDTAGSSSSHSRQSSRQPPSLEDDIMSTNTSGEEPIPIEMSMQHVIETYELLSDSDPQGFAARDPYAGIDLNSLFSAQDFTSFLSYRQQPGVG